MRRHGPSRNDTVTNGARFDCMLGAPRSPSAQARGGTGGAWRLQAPAPSGVAAVSVGIGPSASLADGLRRARPRRRHRGLPAAARRPGQRASASASARHRRRRPARRDRRNLARPRGRATDGGVPPRRAPVVRPPGALRRGPSRRHAHLAARGGSRPYGRVGGPLRVPEDDRAFATRRVRYCARYCARHPVALERLTSDRAAQAATSRSDQSDGPTAGTETADPLEFLARVLVHIPGKGHVTTRYHGWYANRPQGMRQKAAPPGADGPPAIVSAPAPARTALVRPRATRQARRRPSRRAGEAGVRLVSSVDTRPTPIGIPIARGARVRKPAREQATRSLHPAQSHEGRHAAEAVLPRAPHRETGSRGIRGVGEGHGGKAAAPTDESDVERDASAIASDRVTASR